MQFFDTKISLNSILSVVIGLGLNLVLAAGCSEEKTETDLEVGQSANALTCDSEPDETDCVVHVDGDVAASGNGTSWATAKKTVKEGIVVAFARGLSEGGRCDVWVAEGDYYIYKTRRLNTVHLAPRVDVFGGFSGVETLRSERDVAANQTTLDGRNSGTGTRNVYHVVTGANNSSIDGFTIFGGKATGGWMRSRDGGGLYNLAVSPSVRNCTFVGNTAADDGGAIYNAFATPDVHNCRFVNNHANDNGGAIYNFASVSDISNSVFLGNTAQDDGAVIYNHALSSTRLLNCTLYNNQAEGSDSAVHLRYSAIKPPPLAV
jgi:predicted outer membrane repeat protein